MILGNSFQSKLVPVNKENNESEAYDIMDLSMITENHASKNLPELVLSAPDKNNENQTYGIMGLPDVIENDFCVITKKTSCQGDTFAENNDIHQ